jgi:hypothetical protein
MLRALWAVALLLIFDVMGSVVAACEGISRARALRPKGLELFVEPLCQTARLPVRSEETRTFVEWRTIPALVEFGEFYRNAANKMPCSVPPSEEVRHNPPRRLDEMLDVLLDALVVSCRLRTGELQASLAPRLRGLARIFGIFKFLPPFRGSARRLTLQGNGGREKHPVALHREE